MAAAIGLATVVLILVTRPGNDATSPADTATTVNPADAGSGGRRHAFPRRVRRVRGGARDDQSANVAFFGDGLDRLAISSLGGWQIVALDVAVARLRYPAAGA